MYVIKKLNFKRTGVLLVSLLMVLSAVAQEQDESTADEAVVEEANADATGASVTVKSDPVPPLYIASKSGRLQQVRTLIAEGADINVSNNMGRTPLMGAVYYRNRGIVKELLIEGADVNATDAQGRTALMMAVVNNDTNIVSLLIGAGADVSLQDNNKNTAASLSENIKNKKLAKLLEQ